MVATNARMSTTAAAETRLGHRGVESPASDAGGDPISRVITRQQVIPMARVVATSETVSFAVVVLRRPAVALLHFRCSGPVISSARRPRGPNPTRSPARSTLRIGTMDLSPVDFGRPPSAQLLVAVPVTAGRRTLFSSHFATIQSVGERN